MELDDLNRKREYREKLRRLRRIDGYWNLGTLILILMAAGLVGVSVTIYFYPENVFNPFPPSPQEGSSQVAVQLTETRQNLPLESTLTVEPTEAITPSPSETPGNEGDPTPEVLETTAEEYTGTPGGPEIFSYGLKGEPAAIDAFNLTADQDCQWMGVGGQVVDLQNRPVVGLLVKLGGIMDGQVIEGTSLTGTVPQFGDAGFEFTLADKPAATSGTLWVQLLDPVEKPLTGRVFFDTYDDCKKNLILINFKQER